MRRRTCHLAIILYIGTIIFYCYMSDSLTNNSTRGETSTSSTSGDYDDREAEFRKYSIRSVQESEYPWTNTTPEMHKSNEALLITYKSVLDELSSGIKKNGTWTRKVRSVEASNQSQNNTTPDSVNTNWINCSDKDVEDLRCPIYRDMLDAKKNGIERSVEIPCPSVKNVSDFLSRVGYRRWRKTYNSQVRSDIFTDIRNRMASIKADREQNKTRSDAEEKPVSKGNCTSCKVNNQVKLANNEDYEKEIIKEVRRLLAPVRPTIDPRFFKKERTYSSDIPYWLANNRKSLWYNIECLEKMELLVTFDYRANIEGLSKRQSLPMKEDVIKKKRSSKG